MRHGPAQGWEQCPGSGQQQQPVGLNWWQCPTCGWVGWKHIPPAKLTPRHQRPAPSTLF